MRRRLCLLRAAWWGVLASHVDLLSRLTSFRRAPVLAGAAVLALVLAPALLLLQHGDADQQSNRTPCGNYLHVHFAAPIPLAQGSASVVTTPYYARSQTSTEFAELCVVGRGFDDHGWRNGVDQDDRANQPIADGIEIYH